MDEASPPAASVVLVTLDHNCIIALEGNEPAACHIRHLCALHARGAVTVRVTAVGANENLPGGGRLQSFREFQMRLARLGLGDLNLLKPKGIVGAAFVDYCVCASDKDGEHQTPPEAAGPNALETLKPFAVWGAAFWDQCIWADEEDPELLETIHEALFGTRNWCIETRRGRNQFCDAMGFWCHVHYGGGIFVTSDVGDFGKPATRQRLQALSPCTFEILSPQEAVERLHSLSE